jgi:hypothetical protein
LQPTAEVERSPLGWRARNTQGRDHEVVTFQERD